LTEVVACQLWGSAAHSRRSHSTRATTNRWVAPAQPIRRADGLLAPFKQADRVAIHFAKVVAPGRVHLLATKTSRRGRRVMLGIGNASAINGTSTTWPSLRRSRRMRRTRATSMRRSSAAATRRGGRGAGRGARGWASHHGGPGWRGDSAAQHGGGRGDHAAPAFRATHEFRVVLGSDQQQAGEPDAAVQLRYIRSTRRTRCSNSPAFARR
jgi:hypothetical protein